MMGAANDSVEAGLRSVRHLILDMDGVLWRGSVPTPGLAGFFAQMAGLGVGLVLATNNATRSVADYAARLAGYGIEVDPKHILSSGVATASHLANEYPAGSAAYVVGETALHEAMADRGFAVLDPDGDLATAAAAPAALVVAGLHRQVRYHHLALATLHINAGAAFVGTNPDVSVPHELGSLPGAGSILAALAAATGVEPTVVGKPGPIMFREALRRLGADAGETLMVGDRLETDIVGGHNAGLRTAMVLSGISSAAEAADAPIRPDFVFDDVVALGQALARAHR